MGATYDQASSYVHTQTTPSVTWVINHELGVLAPVIDCWIDDGGIPVNLLPDTVAHTDVNTATITFSTGQFGTAICV